MGAVTGLLGMGGGAAGTGFSGPTTANVVNPTNAAQTGAAYTGVQQSLGDQQGLLTALQGQNGVGNQSQVYNQLQGVANGTGPNPAQAMLNQQTGTNVANQAALMAGQRGAGANVGLMARQAAQTGGQLQQTAVGQGATMQANQSLNAISAAGNMANTQAANQISQTNANNSAQQSEQQNLLNAQQGVNSSNVASQASVNAGNAALASNAMTGQQGLVGGVMSGASSALGLAQGGMVPAGPRSHIAKTMQSGGQVQGTKSQDPVVNHDSYANDKIPALVTKGEFVIDLNTMNDKSPQVQQAIKIVRQANARNRGKK